MIAPEEFFAGWCGGVSGILVGHPFDTVKSRLQVQGIAGIHARYSGTFHCFFDIVKTEGIYGLYKGMASPLVGMASINAIIFGFHGMSMKYLQPQGGPPTLLNTTLSGAIAGTVQCVICCPMELIKLRMQVQGIGQDLPHSSLFTRVFRRGPVPPVPSGYVGPWQTTINIYHQDGIRGLNKGMGVTILRETPAFGFYFATYEYMTQTMAGEGGSIDDLGPIPLCIAGAMSGINAWWVTYPFDVVKSRIQIDVKQQYSGMLDCFKKSYREEGVRVFYRGIAPTITRAIPTNAATLATYTLCMRYWKRYRDS